MKYFTAEGQYVWMNDSNHPKREPECVFDGLPDMESIAAALNQIYIKGFEEGVWSPDEEESA